MAGWLRRALQRCGEMEVEAFHEFVNGRSLGAKYYPYILLKSLFQFVEFLIRYIPGGVGFKLRQIYYKQVLREMGDNVLIDVGVIINGAWNISIADYVWIDTYVVLTAPIKELRIGRRTHIGPYTSMGGREEIILEDYVGISTGVHIFSGSERPVDGKRMSGPLVPEEYRGFFSAPVRLRKDSFVGAQSVVLPGVELGEGAVLGACSLANRSLPPWTIASGTPARSKGRRDPVTVPDF